MPYKDTPENKIKHHALMKRHYQRHKTQYHARSNKRRNSCRESWIGFMPIETYCEVCEKKIYFNGKIRANAIFFDHKRIDVPIKEYPSHWLASHYRTPENERIWKECNFGMLCRKCNLILPLKNRKEYIEHLINYLRKTEGILV